MTWQVSPKSGKGFTLVELMVTVVIMAILMSIAVPSFLQYQATQSVRSAASDLVDAMVFARSEAVKRNTEVSVSAKSTWVQGWVVKAGGLMLREFSAHNDVEIDSNVSALSYGNDGRANEEAAFEIKSGTAEVSPRCIRVSGSGKSNNRIGACS